MSEVKDDCISGLCLLRKRIEMNQYDNSDMESASMRVTDTAEWRMSVYISPAGISAYLKNIENPMLPLKSVVSREWDVNSDTLLRNIENAVYDHPEMLDDFTTDIVVETPRTLWVPESTLDYEGAEHSVYTSIYPAEPEDIMKDEIDGMVCLYTLIPGLQPFLLRTFPGARTMSHLYMPLQKFRSRTGELPRMYVDIRCREADFYLFDGRNMLLCATHAWASESDIEYHVFNILDIYGIDLKKVEISLSGLRDVKKSVMLNLRKFIDYVMLTMLPKIVDDNDMPLGLSLCVNRLPGKA